MKKSAFFQIIRVLLLLCVAAPLSAVAAPDPVATVVAVRGTATAQGASGAARNLAIKSPVFQNDVLKTDLNGQLQIIFTDNSIISLGHASEMKIAEYRWQPGQKDGALKTQVKEGAFRVMGGALAKDAPQNFKTETPTATIGIRGSMYAFRSTRDSLSVVFQGGKGIDLYNEHGRISITLPGFGSRVVLNQRPEPPHRFTTQELNNINRQLNGNGSPQSGPPAGETINTVLTDTTTFGPPPPPVLPPTNEFPDTPSNLSIPSTTAILNTSFSGSYSGGLKGIYTSAGAATPFTGTFGMFVNFSGGVNPAGFYDGFINVPYIDSYSVEVTAFNPTATSNSFSGTFSGATVTTGTFTGAFYGPGAEVVKGNFSGTGGDIAYPATITTLNGTFGGNRTGGAAAPPN